MDVTQPIGNAAAKLTSLSCLPQLRRRFPAAQFLICQSRRWWCLVVFMLWVVYGIGQGDWVILTADTGGLRK
ncbi:hypothetical protein LRC39_15145 [Rhodopseudomonas sp. P1]|uniref:hypothetical protein n=1 Tax=Rhodopseudomonas sp. P1 TaxID=3434357 RepID=UPI0031FCDB80